MSMPRADDLAKRNHIIDVQFSWPANGGGMKGITSYKVDKGDARASGGALERTLGVNQRYLKMITQAQRQDFYDQATAKHPGNPELRDSLYTALLKKGCLFTVNAMFNCMGNCLLKNMFKSSLADGTGLIFDNVVVAAEDGLRFHPDGNYFQI
jgi:esterase/lipase superfamily enzyme